MTAASLALSTVTPPPLSAPLPEGAWELPSLVRVRIDAFEQYVGAAAFRVWLAIIRRADVHNADNHLTWATARELARDTGYSEITVLRALHTLKHEAKILWDVAYNQMRSMPWSRRRWLRRRAVWGLFQVTHVAVPPCVAAACGVAAPRGAGGVRKGAGRPRKGVGNASSGGEPPILPPEEARPRKRESTQYVCVPSGYVPPGHGERSAPIDLPELPRAEILADTPKRGGPPAHSPTLATPAECKPQTISATIEAQSTPLAAAKNNQISPQNNQNDRTLKIYTKNSTTFVFSSSSSKKKRKRDGRAESVAVGSASVSLVRASSVATSSPQVSAEQPRASHALLADKLLGACSPGPLLSEIAWRLRRHPSSRRL